MNQQPNTNRPGTGVLFVRKDAADIKTKSEQAAAAKAKKDGVTYYPSIVRIMSGEITLPGNVRMRINARYSQRRDEFEFDLVEFDTWKHVSSFKAPGFAGQAYTDTVMPAQGRNYKLRIIRAQKTSPEGDKLNYLRLNMPQVSTTVQGRPDPMFG